MTTDLQTPDPPHPFGRPPIHYLGADNELAYCGEPALPQYITPDGQRVTCSECLVMLAHVDILVLLDPNEAILIRRLRLLRTNGDYGMFVMWQEGHLKINRVLAARMT